MAATLPTTATKDLVDLVDAIRDRKPDAQQHFSVACRQRLVDYINRRWTEDPEGLADLVLVEFMGRLDRLSFKDTPQVWAYLFTIARFRILEHQKAESQFETLPLVDSATDRAVRDMESTVLDRVTLENTLAQLTPEQAEILTLRFFDDLTIAQTAEKTGRTETAVKAMQRRALRTSASLLAAAVVLAVGYLVLVQLQGDTNSVQTSDPAVTTTETSLTDGQRLGPGPGESGGLTGGPESNAGIDRGDNSSRSIGGIAVLEPNSQDEPTPDPSIGGAEEESSSPASPAQQVEQSTAEGATAEGSAESEVAAVGGGSPTVVASEVGGGETAQPAQTVATGATSQAAAGAGFVVNPTTTAPPVATTSAWTAWSNPFTTTTAFTNPVTTTTRPTTLATTAPTTGATTTTAPTTRPTTTQPPTTEAPTTTAQQPTGPPNRAWIAGADRIQEYNPRLDGYPVRPRYWIRLDEPADVDIVFVLNTYDITANRTSNSGAVTQTVAYGPIASAATANHHNEDPWDYTITKDNVVQTGEFTITVPAGRIASRDPFGIDAWEEETFYGPTADMLSQADEGIESFGITILRAEGSNQNFTFEDKQIEIEHDSRMTLDQTPL